MSEVIRIVESLEIHNTLNPKLWIGNKLDPTVRGKVLEIVNEFKNFTDAPLNIADVYILGSNASYNYTENSDLDIHIVCNFSSEDASEEILQMLYNSERRAFNEEYSDIKIRGIDPEIYIEDINSATISNGIYSVYRDMWIKEPVKLVDIPDNDLEVYDKVADYCNDIDIILKSNNPADIINMINNIFLLRKESLITGGEFSTGNKIFKELRSQGLIQELIDKLLSIKTIELSLEGVDNSDKNN